MNDINNLRGNQRICRMQGSLSQTYFIFDSVGKETSRKIYYNLTQKYINERIEEIEDEVEEEHDEEDVSCEDEDITMFAEGKQEPTINDIGRLE